MLAIFDAASAEDRQRERAGVLEDPWRRSALA